MFVYLITLNMGQQLAYTLFDIPAEPSPGCETTGRFLALQSRVHNRNYKKGVADNLGQNLLRQTRILNSITLTTPKSLKHAFSPPSPRPML